MSEDKAEFCALTRLRIKFTEEQRKIIDGIKASRKERLQPRTRGFNEEPKHHTARVNFTEGVIQQAGETSEDKKSDEDKNYEEDDADQDVSNNSSDLEEEVPRTPVGILPGLRLKRPPAIPSLMKIEGGKYKIHSIHQRH